MPDLVADITDRVTAETALIEQEQRVAQLSAKLLVVGSLSASLHELEDVEHAGGTTRAGGMVDGTRRPPITR